MRPGWSGWGRGVGAAGAGLGGCGRCGDRPPVTRAGRRGPFGVGGGGVDGVRAAFDAGDESGVGSFRGVRAMPGFETALAAGDVSSGHVDAVANAAKGLDDAGRERLGELQDALLGFARIEPVSVFERRCRLLGKRLAGDEGESELDQSESGGVGATLGRQGVGDASHPPRPWIRNVTPNCGQRSTPSWRRSNKPTATPVPRSTYCSQIRWWPPCRASGRGIGGCLRSACTSTTTPCSTACTSARCVRPPTGSRCHPKRCAVWRVRRRSCRSCSTAPAKR